MTASHTAPPVASQLRSTGANRELTAEMLVQEGAPRSLAQDIINRADFEIGMGGHSLPEDVAPAVVRRLLDRRDVVAVRPQRAGGATVVAPPVASARHHELSPSERHRLLAQAMKRVASGSMRSHTLRRLVDGGFSEADAVSSLLTIEQQLAGKREALDKRRRQAILKASLQILFGLLLAAVAIVTGQYLTAAASPVLVVTGFRQLTKARKLSFADLVLVNHDG